jgi:hypothetical protein
MSEIDKTFLRILGGILIVDPMTDALSFIKHTAQAALNRQEEEK